MTYLQFHLVFVLPPLLALGPLALASTRLPGQPLGRRSRWAVPAIALIAFAYTTPWDNYLVATGVWSYPNDRVIGSVGFVPYEEYLFFFLQPLLTGAFFMWRLAAFEKDRGEREVAGERGVEEPADSRGIHLLGCILATALIGLGVLALLEERSLYLGLILTWVGPVLLGMWWFMGAEAWRYRIPAIHGVVWPTIYLWTADRVAIALGIWEISGRYTLGAGIFGLPVEEATFFLLTNVLVVLGTLLFLIPGMPSETAAALR